MGDRPNGLHNHLGQLGEIFMVGDPALSRVGPARHTGCLSFGLVHEEDVDVRAVVELFPAEFSHPQDTERAILRSTRRPENLGSPESSGQFLVADFVGPLKGHLR